LRVAAYGALAGLPAFLAVLFAAPADSPTMFRVGAACVGFGGGLFSVGTLTAAMRMEERGFVGLALGAWGAVQATAAGLSIAGGGLIRDVFSGLATAGALGEALAMPVTGYGVVYALELSLLFVTLIAIGPLVGRGTVVPLSERKFGLAELPG
jgi:BCD family chlorophyll transporter-like MFS transporter